MREFHAARLAARGNRINHQGQLFAACSGMREHRGTAQVRAIQIHHDAGLDPVPRSSDQHRRRGILKDAGALRRGP